MTTSVSAYAAAAQGAEIAPLTIERRDLAPNDVGIDILYCGVCHSDLHMVNNDWGFSLYPLVPGHEIIGRVNAVGADVSDLSVGELVGVGCLVDSCRSCASCQDDLQQYCETGSTMTYSSEDTKHGGVTYGGYSKKIVVDKDFVLRVPENLDTHAVAPLLCAGITTWSPLRHWQVKKGDKVGVIGLGGLGHMGVKFAHALGAHVVMVTTSQSKAEDAKKLGADDVLISSDTDAMQAAMNSFDFLLNTIPVDHDVNPYLGLLKRDATMVLVGAIEPLTRGLDSASMIFGRKRLAGSLIGGIKETQEMLDFCGEHNIVADVEMINMNDINAAYQRLKKGDVKYRFVIDITSL